MKLFQGLHLNVEQNIFYEYSGNWKIKANNRKYSTISKRNIQNKYQQFECYKNDDTVVGKGNHA